MGLFSSKPSRTQQHLDAIKEFERSREVVTVEQQREYAEDERQTTERINRRFGL